MGIKMLRLPGPGKNLCKVHNHSTGGSSTIATEDNNILKITGTGNSQWLIPSITNDATATSLSNMKTLASGVKKFDEGQTYTIQIFGAVATINDIQLVSVDKASNQSVTLTNGKATFTPGWDVSDIFIRYNDATTITFNESLTIQVEKGSTATAYEPYMEWLYKPGVAYQRPSRNLFDKSTATNGYTKNDGTVEIVDWYKVSDFIDVEGLENITLNNTTGSTSSSRFYCFYTSEKVFISSRQEANTVITVAVPSNAKYVRIPISPTKLDTCQVEAGTLATEYEPFGPVDVVSLLKGGNN